MASSTVIQPEGWARPRGYSNGLIAPPGSRLLVVAGQIGWDESAQLVLPSADEDAFVAQFSQALSNVCTVVKTAGGEAQHILSLRIYVTDKKRYLTHIKAVGAVYRMQLGKHYPAMALVQVADLLEDGALVEIEALAALP